MSHFVFDESFAWGVATAAHQIEGAAALDGRGPSNWDEFARRPSAIYDGHHAQVACDHYGHLDQDLDLVKDLGVTAYRFSVAWSRVLPQGVGPVNPAGIAFYDRLIDGLLERSITPYLTLFHWDLPAALDHQGGFLNPRSPDWFESWTQVVAERFGDRVKHYFTLNEPHAFIEGGLRHGRHAPGYRLPLSQVLQAGHHALLAHGRAVQVLRAMVPHSWVAMAPVLICATPHSDEPADVEAARTWTFSMTAPELRCTTWWMDPIYGRGYPADGLQLFGADVPHFTSAELDLIAQPLDAVAFNLYDAAVVRADRAGQPALCAVPPGGARTAFNWPVSPRAHYYGPCFAQERYAGPIVIAENGLSCRDWIHLDGHVHDADRVDFLLRHLTELQRAAQQGVRIDGYFHWSLLDNFEWNHGYRERFGLVYVDYQTLQRTKKDSFYVYRDVIAQSRRHERTRPLKAR